MSGTGRPNRVRPDAELIIDPARGMFWGNRGALLDSAGRPARHHRGRGWVICRMEFHGRHRTQWQPGRLTELYFLDEATALAAGHRPCGECRHADYRRFADAWCRAHPNDPATAPQLDARLHRDRLTRDPNTGASIQRSSLASLNELPTGTMIEIDGRIRLVAGNSLWAWSPAGYSDPRPRPSSELVRVLTPGSTVAALRAGYRPVLHPSASRGAPGHGGDPSRVSSPPAHRLSVSSASRRPTAAIVIGGQGNE